MPLQRIVGVELDDADEDVVGTLFEDTVHRRRYCGEGAFDLTGMVTALRTAGWDGPWGVEILSVEHRSLPVGEALARAGESARAVLAWSVENAGSWIPRSDCCVGSELLRAALPAAPTGQTFWGKRSSCDSGKG